VTSYDKAGGLKKQKGILEGKKASKRERNRLRFPISLSMKRIKNISLSSQKKNSFTIKGLSSKKGKKDKKRSEKRETGERTKFECKGRG